MSTISEMLIKIGADSSGLTKELSKSEQSLNQAFRTDPVNALTDAIGGTTDKVTGLISSFSKFASFAAGGFGLAAVINSAVEAGDAIYNLSMRLRISTAEASGLSRILRLTGNDVETFGSAFTRLDKTITSGNKNGELAKQTLEAVGISITDSNGKLLPLNEQLKNMADGYKKATEAGYGQEFIMNTLGVRGLALEKTLRNYSEAAADAAKVQGIGLNPEEMHRVSEELKILQMQASQIGYAASAVLLPFAQQAFPILLDGLSSTARFLATNREELVALTKNALEFLAVYESVKALSTAGAAVQSLFSAGNAGTEAALTAAQEASIERRIAMVERAGQREITVYMRSKEYQALAETEKAQAVAVKCAEVETRYAEMAARIRAEMTAAYAGITETGVAANGAVIASAEAKGAAEVVASKQTVEANAVSAASAEGVVAANTQVAVTATAAGTATVASAGASGGAVSNLTRIVWNLAGGWLGVAAAIAYATYKLVEYQAKQAKKYDQSTYYMNGQQYSKGDDGKWYLNEKVTDWEGNGIQNLSDYTNYQKEHRVEVTDDAALANLEAAAEQRRQDNMTPAEKAQAEAEKKAAEAQEKSKADIEAIKAKMGELTANTGKSAAAATKAAAVPAAPKTYQVELPIGEAVYAEAQKHIGTPYQLDGGGADSDWSSTDCAKLVKDVMEILNIPFGEGRSVDVVASAAVANGSYHEWNSGYVAQKGDLITMDNGNGDKWGHIGISNGAGGYLAANSSTGVAEHDNFAGFTPTGIISMAQYTGGKTFTATVDDAGKAAAAAAQKVANLKKEYASLYQSMDAEITKNTGTEYEYGLSQIAENVTKKKQQIAKMAAGGIDTKSITAELGEYEKALKANVTDKWTERMLKFKLENADLLASITGDYAEAARAEYDVTVKSLDKQRDEKIKALGKDKNDLEAQKAVQEWYYNSVTAAALKSTQAIRESHDKLMQDLKNRGDYMGVYNTLDNNPEDGIFAQRVSGQKKLAETYEEIWKVAHTSMEENIANSAESLYSGMSSSITEFIKGTKSAMDVVHDFGNLVLSTIAEIVAKRFAANMTASLLGSVMGNLGTSYAPSTSWNVGADVIAKFASGGVVTAPTLGLIGEGGESEAVMPLSYLRANFGGGGNGGVIVNITNNKSDADVKVADTKYDDGLGKTILSIVVNGATNNTDGFQTNMKAALMGG